MMVANKNSGSNRKKWTVGFLISVFTLTGILATRPSSQQEEPYTNLKILSNKLTDEEMDGIMHRFNSALGVTCKYCHVRKKNVPYPEPMDFASDERPEKKQARAMLAMTIRLNKKYFNVSVDNKIQIKPKIWCATCHQGELINPKPNQNKPDSPQ
jgi:hypothetical protein